MNFEETLASLRTRMIEHPDFLEKHSGVVDSLLDYQRRTGTLTLGQQSYLASLSERYSQDSLNEEKEWANDFDSEKRLNAYRMALYYKPTAYFTLTVAKIIHNKDHFTLSKKEYRKFCENKYARRVLSQYEAQPLYTVGQLVEFRKTNKLGVIRGQRPIHAARLAAVLQVDALPIVRAAKGARIYKVLPVGGNPFFAHESDLKKARKKLIEAR